MTAQEVNSTKKRSPIQKRVILLLIAAIVILALGTAITAMIFRSTQPERSIANFCLVAKQQKTVLTTGVSYDKRLEAYEKLEAVSPDDIQSDIATIRKGYESIVQNPSNTISAGMGMSGAENRRTDYITKNCTNF